MNTLRARLKNGENALGTWCVLPSSSSIEVIASTGFDFVIIDMEHGPHSFETGLDMARAAQFHNCSALVRVPGNLDTDILRALEIGSDGVLVPQISSMESARYALRAMKYGPLGNRGFSPFTRSGNWSATGAAERAQKKNEDTLSVLLVEGIEGINSLDEILTLETLDVVYLGTYDLSQSAGHPGQPNHPEVLKYVEQCVSKIRKSGKAAGCLAQTSEQVSRWKQIGIQFIPYLADCAILKAGCEQIASQFKTL